MAVNIEWNVTQFVLRLSLETPPSKLDGHQQRYDCNQNNERDRHESVHYPVDSVARRLYKRSYRCLRKPSESTIFSRHQANHISHTLPETNDHYLFTSNLSCHMGITDAFSLPRYPFPYRNGSTCDTTRSMEMKTFRLVRERQALLQSLNTARVIENSVPLILDTARSEHIQINADLLSAKQNWALPSAQSSMRLPLLNRREVQITLMMEFVDCTRLCSPPSFGALAAGEMWISGKYRGHEPHLSDSERYSSSARGEMAKSISRRIGVNMASITNRFDDVESVHTSAESIHRPDCDCHLRPIFEAVIQTRWKYVGIGRSADYRWIVELAEDPFLHTKNEYPR